MDHRKREALEAAGYVFADAEDFLGLTDEERAEVSRRVRGPHLPQVQAVNDWLDEMDADASDPTAVWVIDTASVEDHS